MRPLRIFLIGMPGSGKSTLGRQLSSLTGFMFFDLDKQIELSEGKSVTQLFSEAGEKYFRQVETNKLRELVSLHERFVLSTGGGTPCFHQNMDYLLMTGKTIFLDPPLEVIQKRLQENKSRPILMANPEIPLQKKLINLRNERIPFYSKASLTITDPEILAERLIQLIN